MVAALCDPESRTAIAIPNEPRQKPIPADRSRSRLRSPTGSPTRRSSERRGGRLTTQPSKPLCCHRRQGRNRDRRSKSKSRAAEIVVRELISYEGDNRRECPTPTDSQQRLALFWGSHFPKAPSGDLIHQSARGGWGLVARKGRLVLATDLLHHGHKVRGVVFPSRGPFPATAPAQPCPEGTFFDRPNRPWPQTSRSVSPSHTLRRIRSLQQQARPHPACLDR